MVRMSDVNLASMSLKELRELLVRVDSMIVERTAIEQITLRKEFEALAEGAGYSLEELFDMETSKRRKKT